MKRGLNCAILGFALLGLGAGIPQQLGYKDTPLIPGTAWHIHDPDRPQPRVVTAGATFSHGAAAPSDASVLFDGRDLSAWQLANGQDAPWKIEGGYMEVVPRSGSIRTRGRFADFQLHLEFATPAEVRGTSQQRGNSGVLINGMYEVQILDSYDNRTYPDGQCGALYGQTPPLVNASKQPGQWQSYDIVFESPRWDSGGKIAKKANVTVIHNGLVLHHRRDFIGTTPHRVLGTYILQSIDFDGRTLRFEVHLLGEIYRFESTLEDRKLVGRWLAGGGWSSSGKKTSP